MTKFTYLAAQEQEEQRPVMKFRLTYEGEVPSGQSSPGKAKMDMRASFHGQIERLWSRTFFLNNAVSYSPDLPERLTYAINPSNPKGGHLLTRPPRAGVPSIPLNQAIGNIHKENGFRFVPLARRAAGLKCGLDILFLRSDGITTPVSSGDLDNRVKTIIDALKRPKNANELTHYKDGDNSLFYVLLEDDDLIDSLTVEADNLLSPHPNGGYKNARWAKVIVSVSITPFAVDGYNMGFL